MNLQALLIRATASIAFGLIATAAIVIARPATNSTVPVNTATAHAAYAPQPVVLPTIHVRPTATERLAATASRRASASGNTVVFVHAVRHDESTQTSLPVLRGLGSDMPYYSFGKVLPRISVKE